MGIRGFCISVASAVAGCGTFVPDITEPILGAGSGPLLVRAIVQSIHCELCGAVTHVIDQDKLNVQAGLLRMRWLLNSARTGNLHGDSVQPLTGRLTPEMAPIPERG